MKIDYTIKGTKLPIIPEGTEYRIVDWDYDAESSSFKLIKENFISYGWNHYKGYTYILCEKENYKGSACFMIKLNDIQKLTKTQEPMTRKIKYSDAQRIVDIACETWKELLFNSWGKDIVLKKDINIPSEDYQNMRKACTEAQHKLFDDIFGKDKPQFKIGDWVYIIDAKAGARGANDRIGQITNEFSYNGLLSTNEEGININFNSKIWRVSNKAELRLATEEEIKAANVFPDGTPCLVRGGKTDPWILYYADGKGGFYRFGKKSGITTDWKYSMKLDMNNLPVNE